MLDILKEALSGIGAYIWFVGLACIGGTANYIGKVKKNKEKAFSIVELLGEWVLSGFAGDHEVLPVGTCLGPSINHSH